jgi:hypothetical protein
MKKSNVLLLVAFIVVLTNFKTEAQSLDENKGKIYVGSGLGLGFVNPKEINKDIEDYYGDNADIILAFNAEVNIGYFISNEIEVKGALIAAAAFSQVEGKDMIGMANNKVNFLTRLAPEIIGNYYFSLNHYSSLYVGGGVSFNKMALYIDSDDVSSTGKAKGFLINIGLLPQIKRNQTYVELKVNFIKDKFDYMNFSGINLNYGVRF